MICADCESPASWVFDDKGALAVPYCDRHLPAFLRQRANDGNLTRATQAPLPPPLPDPGPIEAPPALEDVEKPAKRKPRAKDENPADTD